MEIVVASVTEREKLIPKGTMVGSCEEVERVHVVLSSVQQEQHVDGDVPAHMQNLLSRSAACLEPRQMVRLAALLCSYTDVFSAGDLDLRCTALVKYHSNSLSIKQPPWRVTLAKWQEMEKGIDELIAQGVVEKSWNPWSSAVILVRKKDGTTRCCVDYMVMNNVTVKDLSTP